jgi:hypothetical protein
VNFNNPGNVRRSATYWYFRRNWLGVMLAESFPELDSSVKLAAGPNHPQAQKSWIFTCNRDNSCGR